MVFKKIFSNSKQHQAVFLGSPEAEAEANRNSAMPLLEVYEDYHDLGTQLSREKFIVIARKGCGKSAFGEYVAAKAENEPNLFASFVRGSDCHFERLVQLGKSTDDKMAPEALFTWLVLTNILKLVSENQVTQGNKKFQLLKEFLRKNSGYIEINEYQLNELVTRQGWEVNIEPLRRYFRASRGKNLEIRSGRAPFFKLIPHLEQVLVEILTEETEKNNGNSYVLFFDDLDVGFSSESEDSCESIISLLRACRKINNELFGKHDIDAKVIVFLRDDIEAHLTGRYADTAKLFASYGVKISWFQDSYLGSEHEDELFMRQFINKRIQYAFDKANVPCNTSNPWGSLVDESVNERSTFKYILNNTLFRPRDLLLFFQPLQNGAFKLPLGYSEIQSLVQQYSEELSKEIKNELSSFYSVEQVEMIFNAIGEISKPRDMTYEDATKVITQYCTHVDAGRLLRHLFSRSIIGNVDEKRWFTFKCRQPVNSPNPTQLNPNQKIIIQYGVNAYVQRHGYA